MLRGAVGLVLGSAPAHVPVGDVGVQRRIRAGAEGAVVRAVAGVRAVLRGGVEAAAEPQRRDQDVHVAQPAGQPVPPELTTETQRHRGRRTEMRRVEKSH